MPALNGNTQYCHLVDREDSDNLVVPGTLTVAGVALTPVDLSDAPVEVDSASVTLAADLHAALVTLGLVVDVA